MSLEILDYRYTPSWNLDLVLKDQSFNQNIRPNFPTIVGTVSTVDIQAQSSVWKDYLNGKRRGKPSELRNSTSDSVASFVCKSVGTTSECIVTSATCSGSSYALYTASLYSLDRQLPVVVFCGDSLMAGYDQWHFKSFGALDQDTGLPFDKSSKGFRMGSGAVVMLVKHPSVKFNMDALATINRFHFYTNPDLVANPGAVDDILNNLPPIDYRAVQFWNAHATGTPVGDSLEYELFSRTCKHGVPIVSYKGYTGHCISGSGAIEIAMALDGRKHNKLLPNIIKQEAIASDERIITSEQSFPGTRMLKVNLGFGGRTSILEIDLL